MRTARAFTVRVCCICFLVVLTSCARQKTELSGQILPVATDSGNQADSRAPSGLDDLAFLIGRWELTTTFDMGGGNKITRKARLHARYALGGFGILVEQIHSNNPGVHIFVASHLYTIHPETNEIMVVGINTLGNRKSQRGKKVGDELVFIESGELFRGQSGQNRVTFLHITTDRFELRMEHSDDEQTWTDNGYSFVAIRKK